MIDVPEPPPTIGDTRDLLTGYLDYYRSALLRKLDGLSEEGLRTSGVPSGWTPLELLKHLTHVEIRWLRWRFLGEDVPDLYDDRGPGGRREDPWRVLPEVTFAEVREGFEATAARSRQIVADAALSDVSARTDDEHPGTSLAWILFHLLQEYARHVGQLDVVRERFDGAVGE
ncbi:DinB family protein [Actinomadura flavalba]|uniref:DinB family protein n=1 Tax=Actinomadura flavalba TaxID=1120938 RepID=UPI00036B92D9|nr:DinB family protein [Actinomadura flavalba]